MFKKIMVAALAAGALALNAPVAMAEPPQFDCGFDSNQQELATGQNYEGVIYGYRTDAGSLRCYITVNGSDVGADVEVNGPGANAERISFAAADTDSVQICWEGSGIPSGCADSTHTQVPPQAVIDLLDSIFAQTALLDPLICGHLASLAGSYGPITIGSDGDVTLPDPIGLVWDCPPYV